MTFSAPVPGSHLQEDPSRVFWLASAVIPMGWVLAVTVFQHLHRRLAVLQPPAGAGLNADREWRNDQAKPLTLDLGAAEAWW